VNEAATIAAALVPLAALILGGWLAERAHVRSLEDIRTAHEVEREVLRGELKRVGALLRDAQNRITAKDLQGYMVLTQAQAQPANNFGGRSDLDEAALEARRQGILDRHREMMEAQG